MRTIELNLNDPPRKLMEVVLRELELYAKTTDKPRLHAWQVRLYTHIISHPSAQADDLSRKYFDAARPYHGKFDSDSLMKRYTSGAWAVGFTEPFPGIDQ